MTLRTPPDRSRLVPLGASVICAALLCLSGAASAQTLEDMLGKSIIVKYRETLHFQNGNVYTGECSELLYISPERHIFLRLHYNARFGNNGSETHSDSFDAEGDEQGNGPGGRTKFRWDGSGFSRSWTERNGDRMSESIVLQGSSCRFERNRDTNRPVSSSVSQSCSVRAGNVMR
jgi:hypothetical protein